MDPMVLGCVLTSLGSALTALFAWLTARDKLRYDATTVSLQADVKRLSAENVACGEGAKVMEAQIAKLEEQRLTDTAELNHLRGQFQALESKVDPRKPNDPKSGAHKQHGPRK